MKKLSLLILFFIFSFSSCASPAFLYDVKTGSYSTLEEGVKTLDPQGFYILGETHYVEDVQKGQGQFIEAFVGHHGLENNFSVAWEFMDYPRQADLENLFSSYVSDQLSLSDLMTDILGREPGKHMYYAPLFESAKKFGGKMVATNAPRSWKSIIVKQGFGALSADRVPSNMERGSKEYFERFKTAIGGHGTPQQIENYFMAQSYTDAVMARSMVDLSEGVVTFMAVGSFHSDFDHGLPAYLRKISNAPVKHVRILDFKGLSESERAELLKADSKYGDKASLYLIMNK
jgi:uncharacterized iron-regulated protein